MLQSQLNAGPVPQVASGAWHRFCHNPHVRSELGAVVYLACAAGGLALGLRIAPAVCVLIAVAMVGTDLYDWRHPRH